MLQVKSNKLQVKSNKSEVKNQQASGKKVVILILMYIFQNLKVATNVTTTVH